MRDAQPVLTQMVISPKVNKDGGNPLKDVQLYKSVIGALLYLNHKRPDIAYSVNRVAQYMHAPCTQHWAAVKHILRYLYGTLYYGLVFFKAGLGLHLVAFIYVNWAINVDDRHSISAFCVFLGVNLVSWGSKCQRSVSRLTTEAEYRAFADVVADVVLDSSLVDRYGDFVLKNSLYLE
ncbi:secreted RxLR effector protein 161-like [Hibiscus syriacus]|uniref:secreted RxLR effector protein 161-like n=1 Tax=Hibiscus syriacus TaxID=106335 RepID=UPI001923DCD9|nr:secreted RxLR effector protein 161-like [Hibiscus syriacus]